MGQLRRQKFLIAWIAIFGLMTNLAAAALCVAAAKPAAADSQLSLLGDFAPCLHDAAEPLQVEEGNAPHPAAKPCPLCTTTAAVALVLAIGALLGVIVIAPGPRLAFDFIIASGDELRRAGLGSRAPPLPV